VATALRLADRERCDEAAPLISVLLPDYLELEDYLLDARARCAAVIGDGESAARDWQDLLHRHPDSLLAPRAALELARRARRRGAPEQARALLRIAEDDAALADRVRLERARLQIAAGDWRGADATLTEVRRSAPRGASGRTAKRLSDGLRAAHPELATRASSLDEARLLMREGDTDAALRIVAAHLAVAPAGQRPVLLVLRADIENAAGERDRCVATLAQIHQGYADSPEAPGALYRAASLLWNSDQDAAAERLFVELLRRYPRHPQVTTARYAIGRIEQAAGRDDAAIAAYRELIRATPRAKLASEARWRIGWIHYTRGRWQEAANSFERLARGRRVGDAADALYWRGRALERAGQREQARGDYQRIVDHAPDSYYSMLAEQRLGRAGAAPRLHAPAAFAERIGPAPEGVTDSYHLVRARELQAAGLRALARRELAAFERGAPRSAALRPFLLDSYPAVDGYRDAIRLVAPGDALRDQILYPIAFPTILPERSAQHGLDQLFVLSLMRQESIFDPAARSPANARGLMQLLPSTAADVARRIGQPADDLDLFDPETNITLGTAHLAELAERYGGDRIRVLAAYNAGATAVDKWQARFGTLPPDEFVESITYRETRDYVKRILANMRRYQRLYGR